MVRPPGVPGAPPPPKRAAMGDDALMQWLSQDDEGERQPARKLAKGRARPPRARDDDTEARQLVEDALRDGVELSMDDLRAATGLGVFRLGTVVSQLNDEGAISVVGEPGEERLRSAG
jgi:hypothetical protein